MATSVISYQRLTARQRAGGRRQKGQAYADKESEKLVRPIARDF
ncbi:hypothetical protein [Lusitaniella coriacea]